MFHALRTSMDSDCCDVSTLCQLFEIYSRKKTLERVLKSFHSHAWVKFMDPGRTCSSAQETSVSSDFGGWSHFRILGQRMKSRWWKSSGHPTSQMWIWLRCPKPSKTLSLPMWHLTTPARLDVLGLASRKTSLNDRGLEEVLDWESRVGVVKTKSQVSEVVMVLAKGCAKVSEARKQPMGKRCFCKDAVSKAGARMPGQSIPTYAPLYAYVSLYASLYANLNMYTYF